MGKKKGKSAARMPEGALQVKAPAPKAKPKPKPKPKTELKPLEQSQECIFDTTRSVEALSLQEPEKEAENVEESDSGDDEEEQRRQQKEREEQERALKEQLKVIRLHNVVRQCSPTFNVTITVRKRSE
jgi:hypothetical protein